MVGHDLHLDDLKTELAGDFPRDLLEAIVDTVHEDGSAVLRAEDYGSCRKTPVTRLLWYFRGIDLYIIELSNILPSYIPIDKPGLYDGFGKIV